MAKDTNNTEENNPQTPVNNTDVDIQKSLDDAHAAAKTHFDASRLSRDDTYQAMHRNAEQAADIIQNLHNTIASSTPESSTKETMKKDADNAAKTTDNLKNEADPLKAYAGYSAYAVPQSDKTNDESRNYHDNPLTYDEFSVSKDKKDLNVKYKLTEVTPGKFAKATNDPNNITGSSDNEQSFSYNEHKSGGKTIVTTELTEKGRHSPGSPNFNHGDKENDEFQNKRNKRFVYDKNEHLVEKYDRSESNHIISTTQIRAHKGEDMSQEEKGYFQTMAEATTVRGEYTRFSYTIADKNHQEKSELSGYMNSYSERYFSKKDKNHLAVSHHQNEQGEWIYEGERSTLENDEIVSSTPLSPALAKKEFDRLQKDVNKGLKELTGAESLKNYAAELGAPKPHLSLSAMWYNTPNADDKAKAEQANAEFIKQYANKPATIIATKEKSR